MSGSLGILIDLITGTMEVYRSTSRILLHNSDVQNLPDLLAGGEVNIHPQPK